MTPRGRKLKGNGYERTASKLFSRWWADDDVSLFRNAGSGNRRVDEVYGGDIAPASDRARPWPLCVEVKKAEGWSIEGFLQQNPSEELLSHMLQCLSASYIGCNKIPVLVCAKNWQKPLCFLYPHPQINRKGKVFIARFKWVDPIPEELLKRYPWDGPVDFFCLRLDVFFQTFDRSDFPC